MYRYAVHYKSHLYGDNCIHIHARCAAEAVQHVQNHGIAFDNGIIKADKIVGVQKVQQ